MENENAQIERPKIITDEHLSYLDALKESGETNMCLAVDYLVEKFDLSEYYSKVVLLYWMDVLNKIF